MANRLFKFSAIFDAQISGWLVVSTFHVLQKIIMRNAKLLFGLWNRLKSTNLTVTSNSHNFLIVQQMDRQTDINMQILHYHDAQKTSVEASKKKKKKHWIKISITADLYASSRLLSCSALMLFLALSMWPTTVIHVRAVVYCCHYNNFCEYSPQLY